MVRTLYTSAAKHVGSPGVRPGDCGLPEGRRGDPGVRGEQAPDRDAAGGAGSDRSARAPYWQQVVAAETSEDGRKQTQLLLDGLDAEKGQYDELVSAARQILRDLVGRSVLEGEPVGRIYAAYRLQLANEQDPVRRRCCCRSLRKQAFSRPSRARR